MYVYIFNVTLSKREIFFFLLFHQFFGKEDNKFRNCHEYIIIIIT